MVAKGAAAQPLTITRREALAATFLLSGAISKFASPPLDRAAPDVSRTREGRLLSRSRYRNAESFFLAIGELRFPDTGDLLYQTGIVAQIGRASCRERVCQYV